jgi:hypothetical protein
MKFRSGKAAFLIARIGTICLASEIIGFSFTGVYPRVDFNRTEEASWPVRAAEYAMARWHGRNPPGSS